MIIKTGFTTWIFVFFKKQVRRQMFQRRGMNSLIARILPAMPASEIGAPDLFNRAAGISPCLRMTTQSFDSQAICKIMNQWCGLFIALFSGFELRPPEMEAR
jgi:hypothetical protein